MRILLTTLCAAFLLLPAVSHATSIAVVDMQRVMGKSKAANSARSQLDSQQQSFQKQVTATETDLQAKDKELAKQRGLLSAEEFNKKLKEFRDKAGSAQRDVQQKRLKLRRAFESSIVTIQTKVTAIVESIAKEKNFDMVLPSNQSLYTKSSLDITDEVLNRLDKDLPSMKVDFGN
jgi:outer membrane protein